jgi:hypothetical protein
MTFGCQSSERQMFLVLVGFINNFTVVVDVITQLNLSRSEVHKISPVLLQSFDFSTLNTKIDLMDLKAHMKLLINKVFHWMLKLHCFKFLLVERSALNFRFLWLKNKEEISFVLKIFIALKL